MCVDAFLFWFAHKGKENVFLECLQQLLHTCKKKKMVVEKGLSLVAAKILTLFPELISWERYCMCHDLCLKCFNPVFYFYSSVASFSFEMLCSLPSSQMFFHVCQTGLLWIPFATLGFDVLSFPEACARVRTVIYFLVNFSSFLTFCCH